jgi:IS605 OrfB family transposase
MIVIAYSERRRKIAENRSTRDRVARKALRKLREGERKEDIIYKTAGIIEEIAKRYNAVLVVGNAHRGKSRMASKASKKNLRHRIHQWCASKLVEILNNKPLYVFEESEAYSSSRDPFSEKPIKRYTPSVIRIALRGGRRVKVIKIQMRQARLSNGLTMDRDVIGAINIGLKYLSTDGRAWRSPLQSPMPLGSTATYEPIGVSKTCGSRSKATQNKRIPVTINNHRGTSGNAIGIAIYFLEPLYPP